MKIVSSFLTFILLCFPLLSRAELILDDLAGVYSITSDAPILYGYEGIKVEYTLAVSNKKTARGENIIGLNEIFKQVTDDGTEVVIEKLECQGIAELNLGIITSNVSCKNGTSFEQRVRLLEATGEVQSGEFSAPVYSSLYATEIIMKFKKKQP